MAGVRYFLGFAVMGGGRCRMFSLFCSEVWGQVLDVFLFFSEGWGAGVRCFLCFTVKVGGQV